MPGVRQKRTWSRNLLGYYSGEQCRATLSRRKGSKGGKREECDIHRWYLEACREYDYKGMEDDWFCLLGWRGRR